MMHFQPRLHVEQRLAADIPEPLFRELWRLRLDLIRLRPEVEPEADYASFRSYFIPDANVVLFRAHDSTIQGFFGWHAREVSTRTGSHTIVHAEYSFFRPAARRHVAFIRAAFSCFWQITRRFHRPRFALIGVAYPSSILSVARISSSVRTLRDAGLEPWERTALHDLLRATCGDSFDIQQGVVRMRTTPSEGRRIPRSRQGRALLSWYETHNPQWTEGFGLPVIMHVDAGSILMSLRHLFFG